ncbi:MAG: peptidoglycan-binding domain-containing protein, partial [Deferrisomatales bacterium]
MLTELQDPRIRAVLSRTGDDRPWRGELERLARGDLTLTRRSVGEGAIRAVQRLLIFLGYSTSSTGAFTVDGDFGRGTNRGIAQFQFEYGLTRAVNRQILCYPCSFQTARKEITAIPDVKLDLPTARRMLERAVEAADGNRVTFGRFDDALFHLNCLEEGRFLGCREIAERYGAAADAACERVERETGVRVRREWILAIIRQETAGVCRPRFEQHKLSKLNA